MERTLERKRERRAWWILSTALLVALLASCKDNTGPHAVAGSIAAVGNRTVTGTVGSTLVVLVQVADRHGRPVSGVPVSFTAKVGGGSVSPGMQSSDLAGRATAVWTLGTTAGVGSNELIAASGTLEYVAFLATTVADVPVALKVLTGDNQLGFFSLPLPLRPTVTAVDRFGNTAPFSGTDVQFSSSPGGGSFSGGCCIHGEIVSNNGSAGTIVRPTEDWLLSDTLPSETLTATSPGLAPANIVARATVAPLPSNADWAQLAAQFAAIAVDAFEQARSATSIAPTFTASYMCCNLLASLSNAFTHSASVVNVTGQTSTTLDAGGSGSISLSESITERSVSTELGCVAVANCDLPFTSTHALELPSPGLTASAVLSVVNGIVGRVQQVHLTGSLVYYSGAGGSPHASTADVTFGYDEFPQHPAVPAGVFGVSLTASPLPSVTIPNRADLPAYPQLAFTSAVGEQGQEDDLAYSEPTGLFWIWLTCPLPRLTAIGGDMANVIVGGSVAWPTIAPDYLPLPTVAPNQTPLPPGFAPASTLNLPAGQGIDLQSGNPTDVDLNWGVFGPSVSGTRTPWNAIYQVSYTVKSTGQKAMYTLAYSCQ